MRAYIKKLQSKPEDTRKQILVGTLIVSMSFVCLIWISSFGYKFNTDTSANNTAEKTTTTKPFALFGQTISDAYHNMTASVGNISLPKKQVETKTPDKVIDLIPVEPTN